MGDRERCEHRWSAYAEVFCMGDNRQPRTEVAMCTRCGMTEDDPGYEEARRG